MQTPGNDGSNSASDAGQATELTMNQCRVGNIQIQTHGVANIYNLRWREPSVIADSASDNQSERGIRRQRTRKKKKREQSRENKMLSGEKRKRLSCEQPRLSNVASKRLQKRIERILNTRILEENENLLSFGDDLVTPKEEKTPQLRKWKVYRASKSISDHDSSLKDLRTFREEESSGQQVLVQDMFSSHRFVAVLGGPGSGKSTFLRKYGLLVLEGKICEMKEIQIIHFINASDLATDLQKTDFLTFMFSNPVHGFDSLDQKATLRWMQNEDNQKKILVIIDGLNDIQGVRMDSEQELIRYHEDAEPSVILYNLMQGRFLPQAKILAAARSHGIQNYHRNIRPQETLKLVGFTREDSKYLFQEMTQSAGTDCWDLLTERLKSLCSTPLWLVYIAYMLKCDPHLKMEDASSVLICLLQNFYNKEEWEKNAKTFLNLKRFCLEKLKLSQGIFTESDIEEFALKQGNILDLCLTVPKRHRKVFEPSKRDSYIYFSHMLIQESLACLGFLDLKLGEFKEVLRKHLKTPDFRSVRQMSSGTLLNEKTKYLARDLLKGIPDVKEKAQLLRQSFEINSSTTLNPEELLQHLICVQEMDASNLQKDFPAFPEVVNLDMRVLSVASVHAVSTVISSGRSLSELSFCGCSLDDEKIKTLAESLSQSNLNIANFNLGSNPNISEKGIKDVSRIVRHCNVRTLDMHLCQLKAGHAKTLLYELTQQPKLELKRLLLRSNNELGMDGMEAIAGVVEVAQLEKLDLSHCGVSQAMLRNMSNKHNLNSLQVLLLSGYSVEGNSRMLTVGECTVQNGIIELHINWCKLKYDDLQCLESSLNDSTKVVQLTALNVSNNKINSKKCHAALCSIVRSCGMKRMDIHKCDFSDAQRKELMNSGVKEFLRMDKYRSFELDSPEFHEMLKDCKGRYVDVSLTKTTNDKLSKLPKLLKEFGTRFGKLCLPEGKKATDEDIEILARLLPYISEELWLAEWDISPDGKTTLAAACSENVKKFPNFDIYYAADDTSRSPN